MGLHKIIYKYIYIPKYKYRIIKDYIGLYESSSYKSASYVYKSPLSISLSSSSSSSSLPSLLHIRLYRNIRMIWNYMDYILDCIGLYIGLDRIIINCIINLY